MTSPDEEPQPNDAEPDRAGGQWTPRPLAGRGRGAAGGGDAGCDLVATRRSVDGTPRPDYLIRPLDLGHTAEHVVGVGAVVVVVAAVVALVVAGWRGRVDRRWWPVLVELLLAGGWVAPAGGS